MSNHSNVRTIANNLKTSDQKSKLVYNFINLNNAPFRLLARTIGQHDKLLLVRKDKLT